MRILLIVNATASSVTARARVVIAKALAADHDLTVAETTRRGHAERLAHGAANDGVFVATSLSGGPPFDGWNVPGTQLIAFLDRDFLDPDARVRAIASPMGAALADC